MYSLSSVKQYTPKIYPKFLLNNSSYEITHPEKTADISRRHYWFSREMKCEGRVIT